LLQPELQVAGSRDTAEFDNATPVSNGRNAAPIFR
jgi:hypothetical protein